MGCCKPGEIELKPYILNGKSYCNCTGITVSPGTTVTQTDIEKRVNEITDAEVLRRATEKIRQMSADVQAEIDANEGTTPATPATKYVAQNPTIPKVILLGTGLIIIVLVVMNMKG